jgi:hypothetical protein
MNQKKWFMPVGTRHGKIIINWPAVFFVSAAIAGAILSILVFPNTLQFL